MNKELEAGHKKKLALFISGTISFAIFCVWIFFFIQEKPAHIVKDSNEQGVALFDELKENMGANASGIKESLFFIKEKIGVFFSENTAVQEVEIPEYTNIIEE